MIILGLIWLAVGGYGVRLKTQETSLPGPIVHKLMICYGLGFGLLFTFVGTMDFLSARGWLPQSLQ